MPLPARSNDPALNAELERILYQISVVRQECDGLLNGISEDAFNWSPTPGAWSIAQCLDHLNITNDLLLKGLEAGVRNGRADGKLSDGPYSYNWISRYMFRIMQPPVKNKFRAPKKFRPAAWQEIDLVLKAWNRTHDVLEKLVHEAHGVDLEKVKVPSPVTSLIRYNLGMAFWIQTAHDRRHLWQAREVRNAPGFPAR